MKTKNVRDAAHRDKVSLILQKIERKHNVQILYACEAGSRAWGFPSVDSDFDIRFLYISYPGRYLSVNEGRDVIELPIDDEYDVNGWDIKKALSLFRKSNPSLMEWIKSPIVYNSYLNTRNRLDVLMPIYYNPTAVIFHYFQMAKGNYKDYLKGSTVLMKKYLYVLRPIMAVMWIQQQKSVVPVDFNTMVDHLDYSDRVRHEIKTLVNMKKEGHELGYGPRSMAISRFIEERISGPVDVTMMPKTRPYEPLNELFVKLLEEAWSLQWMKS